MIFSPNSQFIAIYQVNGVVDLFNWESGEKVLKASGADYLPYSSYVLKDRPFSPDSNLLALHTDDHYIHIWDIRGRTVTHKFQSEIPWVAFSQDSKRIAYMSTSEKISTFDLRTCNHMAHIGVDAENTTTLWSFDSNDRLVLFYAAKSSGPVRFQLRGDHTELISRVIQLNDDDTLRHYFTPGYGRLLPCEAHLQVEEVTVPLSIPDTKRCCSHRLSLAGLWIKRGNEKLVYIAPHYEPALIILGNKGAFFRPSINKSRNNSRSNSNVIDTLEFDFSRNETYI